MGAAEKCVEENFKPILKTQLLHGSGISSIPDAMVILPLLGFQSLICENVEHHTKLRLALRDSSYSFYPAVIQRSEEKDTYEV